VWDKLEKRVAKKTSINREQVMRDKKKGVSRFLGRK
jgi:hypothetical protein